MKTANAKIIKINPAPAEVEIISPKPIAPSWDRARALWQSASRGAEDLIELSKLLLALRKEFFAQGGDHKSESFKNQTSARGRLIPTEKIYSAKPPEKGWQETVQEQLGISHQTALRLIERGNAVLRIKGIADGEDVRWKDTKGEIKIMYATEEAQRMAQEALPVVVAGVLPATRAWAGICGESDRSKVGKRRADIDYAAVMRRALVSLRNAAAAWNKLDPEDRAIIENLWYDVRETLPATWGAGQ